jgi:DNA (cytosine-5)-methyltransferase 1
MSNIAKTKEESKKTSDILIKEKRLRLNMTQKELADAAGMPKNGDRTIRRWETGESEPSSLELKAILGFPEIVPFPNIQGRPYRCIDLFAGIGGTRLGFYQTNKCSFVFSSEIDKFAQKTYHANFGEFPVGDIRAVDENMVPDHDILIAGFPCQAFSQAGKKMGFQDTRGTLFFEIARIIHKKRPRAILCENVKNLVRHDGGKTYKVIEGVLKSEGYDVHLLSYHARQFGVPQNRERVYIVCFDKKTVKNYKEFTPPEPTNELTRVGDILEKKVSEKYTISDKLWAGHQRRKFQNKLDGKGFGYSLFNENSQYTNTISARYYKDGSEILIEQPGKNPRKLTPREAARLQGFPEEFIIPVSDTQAYKQFGNSVAVPVINAIALQMIKTLENSDN